MAYFWIMVRLHQCPSPGCGYAYGLVKEMNVNKQESKKMFVAWTYSLVVGGLGIALFYFSGWGISWGATYPSELTELFFVRFERSTVLAIQFNSKYYGLNFVPRLFDSLFISTCGLGLGLIFIWEGIMRSNLEPNKDKKMQ